MLFSYQYVLLKFKSNSVGIGMLLGLGVVLSRVSAADVDDSSLLWQALPGNYDFPQDQQTGSAAGADCGIHSPGP
jgi:hypothetical protein